MSKRNATQETISNHLARQIYPLDCESNAMRFERLTELSREQMRPIFSTGGQVLSALKDKKWPSFVSMDFYFCCDGEEMVGGIEME